MHLTLKIEISLFIKQIYTIYFYYKSMKQKIIFKCPKCGEITLYWKNSIKKIFNKFNIEKDFIFCKKCRENFIINNIPSEEDIIKNQKLLSNLNRRIDEYVLKNYYPYIYNSLYYFTKHLDCSWGIKLLMFKNNMREYPKCYCGNDIKIVNKKIFNKYCCKKCDNESKQRSLVLSKTLTEYHKNNINNLKNEFRLINNKFDLIGDNIIIYNYCKHGDLQIKKYKFRNLYDKHKYYINDKTYLLCDKCLDECQDNFTYDYSEQLTLLKTVHKHAFIEKHIKNKFTELYMSINSFCKNFKEAEWNEKLYIFLNNIKKRPKCLQCNNDVYFLYSSNKYCNYCLKHRFNHTISKGELEVGDFLQSIYKYEINKTYRQLKINNKISKKEIDIFIPAFKIGFEFNGIYFHSKYEDSHINKWKICKNNDINLFFIWEDNWYNKKDVIKSYIKGLLNLNYNIDVKKCILKKISYNESNEFYKNNNLYYDIFSSINIAAYYNNEIYYIMSFRKIKEDKNKLKLVNFCYKLNTNILNIENKIFEYLKANLKIKNIIYYKRNGQINNLSIKEQFIIGYTNPTYWLTDFKTRVNKNHSDKQKYHHKIFDAGNTVYEIEI